MLKPTHLPFCAPMKKTSYFTKNLVIALIGLGLLATLLYAPTAEARRKRYRPNPPRPYTGPGIPKATRGGSCEDPLNQRSLTLAAPMSHEGMTTSTNPTFVWFVPDAKARPLELIVSEQVPGETTWKPIVTKELTSQQGAMHFTLPADKQLQADKRYMWQVSILCNKALPDQDIIAEAPIVFTPQAVNVNVAMSPQEQVAFLAEANLWYDAFQVAFQHPQLSRELLQDLEEYEREAINKPDLTPEQKRQLVTHQAHLAQVLETL